MSSSRISADQTHGDDDQTIASQPGVGRSASTTVVPDHPDQATSRGATSSKEDDIQEAVPPTCFICYDEFDRRRRPHHIPCACQEGAIENRASVHYGCIRAWAAQKATCPLCRAEMSIRHEHFTAPPDLDLEVFITKPLSVEYGTVQCFVKVRKQFGSPVYDLFLEGNNTNGPRLHLLTATWQLGRRFRSTYRISLPTSAGGRHLATVQANFLGTRWMVLTQPADESSAAPEGVTVEASSTRRSRVCAPVGPDRHELACIGYKANRFCFDSGPRSMQLACPAITEEGDLEAEVRPTEAQHLLERAVGSAEANVPEHVSTFKNRSPIWDERYEAYVLNFLGRVRMASVKNFQIVQTDNIANETMLQFGRVSQTIFSMDVQWPFSIVQAFGVCLTSISPKLAVK